VIFRRGSIVELLNMKQEVTSMKILRCTNKALATDLGRHLERIKYVLI
jgi:hypothetical protein